MKILDKAASADVCSSCGVEQALASALRLQSLLAEISSRFVTRMPGRMDETIEETQRLICEALGVDRSTLWQCTADGSGMALTHYWQSDACVPLRRNFVAADHFPWADGMLKRGESFHFSRLDELPPEAVGDAEVLRRYGTKSNATFPLMADGKVIGALAFAVTRAERRWSEEEITGLKLVAQIFSHVVSRHRAEERVEQLRAEIQRSTRASVLGEIAAALAHEINQPLTAILSNAQAARRFIHQGEGRPEEILAILDDIIRDDKRAGDVIHGLRTMLADSPMARDFHSLNELVSEVTAFLAKDMVAAEIEVRLDLAPRMPRIRFARVDIQQLLINLTQNAVNAMVETPADRRVIMIQTRVASHSASVLVKDHGCGIPPDHLDRIFEPFHTTRKDGIGIGLAICRRIAEAHGGRIMAHNRESGGAEFEFSLPLQATAG